MLTSVQSDNPDLGNDITLVGGIAGICDGGIVRQCTNQATVVASNYVGGLVGGLYQTVTIENCYNSGDLISYSGQVAGMGCIRGTDVAHFLNNCYNIGDVSVTDRFSSLGYGIVCEYNGSSAQVNNCYYLKTTAKEDSKGISKTEEEMKQTDFVNTLNNGGDQIWKPDVDNKNSGFPILNWQ